MKKVIHVHQAEIRKRDPKRHPAIIVRTYKGVVHARTVQIDGPCTLVHADSPDHCGARAWIETQAPVRADGKLIA